MNCSKEKAICYGHIGIGLLKPDGAQPCRQILLALVGQTCERSELIFNELDCLVERDPAGFPQFLWGSQHPIDRIYRTSLSKLFIVRAFPPLNEQILCQFATARGTVQP